MLAFKSVHSLHSNSTLDVILFNSWEYDSKEWLWLRNETLSEMCVWRALHWSEHSRCIPTVSYLMSGVELYPEPKRPGSSLLTRVLVSQLEILQFFQQLRLLLHLVKLADEERKNKNECLRFHRRHWAFHRRSIHKTQILSSGFISFTFTFPTKSSLDVREVV